MTYGYVPRVFLFALLPPESPSLHARERTRTLSLSPTPDPQSMILLCKAGIPMALAFLLILLPIEKETIDFSNCFDR